MKLSFRREGGIAFFPGLAGEIVVTDDALPADQVERVEALIEKAARAARAARPAAARMPDARQFRVHAETSRGRFDFVVPEVSEDPALRELAAWLAEVARTRHAPR
jgi:hypothetical protein